MPGDRNVVFQVRGISNIESPVGIRSEIGCSGDARQKTENYRRLLTNQFKSQLK
jgi:hypothetical protein